MIKVRIVWADNDVEIFRFDSWVECLYTIDAITDEFEVIVITND